MIRIGLACFCSLLLFGLIACAEKPQPVSLSESWPAEPRPYGEVIRDWQKHEVLLADFDKLLEVRATFLSPEWRASWVAATAEREKLSASARAAMLEEHKQAAAEHYEIHLIVATYEGRENDLQKGDRSVWRVALVDADGNQVKASSIERDRRPKNVIDAQFPGMDDFDEAYFAKFPRTVDMLTGGKELTLRFSSARGTLDLVWRGR